MGVAVWLRGLGLERYATAFSDNDVDAAVLPRLTADDLIALGVTSVGHRRKLLDAIAALRGDVAPMPEPAATVLPAERRQLTVMFCDLVGSTALSSQLDPEDLREVIAAYHRAVAEIVRSFDGFVAKYMGDGVLTRTISPQRFGRSRRLESDGSPDETAAERVQPHRARRPRPEYSHARYRLNDSRRSRRRDPRDIGALRQPDCGPGNNQHVPTKAHLPAV
jgi:class 3 adenylate cyclase